MPSLSPTRRLGAALLALIGVAGTASCEAVWGNLSVPAAENCVVSGNPCGQGQVCDAVSQLCQTAIILSRVTPARARTVDETPVTITGTNFAPGIVVKWNGTVLQPVIIDSPTQLRVTAPASADGSWRVKLEVSDPGGYTAVRRDLFSYYSTTVTLQPTAVTGLMFSGLFTLRVVPPAQTGRPLIIFPQSNAQLHAISISNDGHSAVEESTALTPPNISQMLVGDLNGN